ncbi:putative transcription factor ARF family [Dioscorea sansibarensis]
MAPLRERRSLDRSVWAACAGVSVQIPTVGSLVYYFPKGHCEQAFSPPDFSSIALGKPYILARVIAVSYLTDADTDEVYARISLDPRVSLAGSPGCSSESSLDDLEDGARVRSFAKILTPSDANNGGGFSVPRYCADSIFPPLDFDADPPVQTLSVRDVHGVAWEFRHIYRGTPRRHLLTTGWSKFVNVKKLVAGDSVVFVCDAAGELFVGIRRNTGRNICPPIGYPLQSGENAVKREAIWRCTKGRVPPESVVEAVGRAKMGLPFEVAYYPMAGSPEFVVAMEKVRAAMGVQWATGMKIKMAVDIENLSRMTWYQGTVSGAALQDQWPRSGSPWRMLQITWDEPEVLQHVKNVSPWQVELVSDSRQSHTSFSAMKKPRVSQTTRLFSESEDKVIFAMSGLNSAMVGNLTPLHMTQNTFPAGMQGARHDPTRVSSLPTYLPNNSSDMYTSNLCGIIVPPKSVDASTELQLGSAQSESSSSQSQGSIFCNGRDVFGKPSCNPSKKTTILLFGHTITSEQPHDMDYAKYNDAQGMGVLSA